MTENGKLFIATCGRCDFQLAVIDGLEVKIRVREQYLYFRGGMLRIICRGCGSSNVWIDKDFEIDHGEEAKAIRETAGIIFARIHPWRERPWFERQKQQQKKGV